MKKKLFSVLALMLVAMTAFAFTACETGKAVTGEYYGFVHGHYFAGAEVKLSSNGSVSEVTFDEIFLPYHWAAGSKTTTATANNTDGTELAEPDNILPVPYEVVDDTIKAGTADAKATRTVKAYAQYIRIGKSYYRHYGFGEYILLINTVNLNYQFMTLDYSLFSQPEAKWYYETIMDEDFALCDYKDTTATGYSPVTFNDGSGSTTAYVKDITAAPKPYGTVNKGAENSTYGGSWQSGEGWQKNVDAMIAWVKANGADFAVGEFSYVATGTDKGWSVDGSKVTDGTSTATLVDFADYMLVIRGAYDNAKAKQ